MMLVVVAYDVSTESDDGKRRLRRVVLHDVNLSIRTGCSGLASTASVMYRARLGSS